MTWDYYDIKKEIDESTIERLAQELIKIIFDFQKEKKIKSRDLELVIIDALSEIKMIRGEMEEEDRVDRLAGARFER